MVNHVFGWEIYVIVAEVGSLLATAENLTKLSAIAHLQNFAKKCSICKFLRQNFVFVNFCNKNLTFFKYPIPKNTTFFWKYFGLGSGIAKNYLGRVSGTRVTLIIADFFEDCVVYFPFTTDIFIFVGQETDVRVPPPPLTH